MVMVAAIVSLTADGPLPSLHERAGRRTSAAPAEVDTVLARAAKYHVNDHSLGQAFDVIEHANELTEAVRSAHGKAEPGAGSALTDDAIWGSASRRAVIRRRGVDPFA